MGGAVVMFKNFKSHLQPKKTPLSKQSRENGGNGEKTLGALEMEKRDRFVLLSAYLDGEITPDENRQVRKWLASDPEFRQLHDQLIKLRHEWQNLPVPTAEQPIQTTIKNVFRRLDRRQTLTVAWGGSAIAALFVALASSVFPSDPFGASNLAQSPQTEANAEPLMIALNEPVVEIPKAPVAVPLKTVPKPSNEENSYKNWN